jgi:hypothetical protein
LREPTPIRPAAVLKMPAFNLSLQEARALAQFFLARESADPSGDWADARSTMRLQAAEAAYQQSLKAVAAADKPPPGSRFDHAMRIVVDRNYCVTCHLVGDYDPQTSDRAKAPDLAAVYMRLRPDWVRRWIAKPTAIAPFTAMGVNIPFDPQAVRQGGIDPRLYHGTSTEQLDALVDLLINFDVYAGRRAGVNSLVQEAAQTAASP